MLGRFGVGVSSVRTVLTLILGALLTAALPLNATGLVDTCEWQFNPTYCGQGVSYQTLSYPATESCIPLNTPMKNVWTNDCSGLFAACTMWIQPDCTGEWSMRIDSPSDIHLGTCFSEYYYISAISCELGQ